jgi:hypothetical protein
MLFSSGYRQDQRVVREGCGEGRGELGDAERAAHEVRGYRYVFQAHSPGTQILTFIRFEISSYFGCIFYFF